HPLFLGFDRIDTGVEAENRAGGGQRSREDAQEIGAVKLPVGPAVAGLGGSTEWQTREASAGTAVAEHHGGWPGGEDAGIAESQGVENGHAIGADLEPGADLGKGRGLFEDGDPRTAAAQRKSRRQAADAAADHG